MSVKLIRTSTVPGSIDTFYKDFLRELREEENYEIVVVSSPGKEMQTIEEREGVRCIEVPMQRHISPIKDLKSLWRMTKLLRREKPNMVHSITPKAGLITMMAARFAGVPVRLHTFTGLIFPTAKGLKKQILMLTDKLTCACATHIIPEGEGVKSDLQTHKITKKPLEVLGNGNIRGIDLDYYNPKIPEIAEEAEKLRDLDRFTFVFIGRIVSDKGINELVKAFEMLKQEVPNVRLLLVGRSEEKLDPLEPETIKTIKYDKDIEAVGQQKDVRPWLLAADALVFPSYREGFPNVVIEAGAMGLPSIVTDINGSREIIEEGKNGLIVPPHNFDDLCKAMKELVLNNEKRNYMASNSREIIASRYEQGYVRSCQKDYYRKILKKK